MVQELERSAQMHINNHPAMSVSFETLIRNPAETVRKIFRTWGLDIEVPHGWELPRERFTGFTPPAGSEEAIAHFLGIHED
jgi:hypothetical protein